MAVLGNTDAALLDQARDGDDAAFTALYRRHHAAVRRLAGTYRRDRPDDLVDATFADAVATLRRGEGPPDRFRSWLFAALHRRAAAPGAAAAAAPDASVPPPPPPPPERAPSAFDASADPWHLMDRPDRPVGLLAAPPPPLPPSVAATGAATGSPDVRATTTPAPVASAAARPGLGGIARETIALAFERLSPQWQVVLWHATVRGQAAPQLAETLAVTPAAAEALVGRGRDQLRQALLWAWLAEAPRPGCVPYRSWLNAYRRRSLDRAPQEATAAHLARCDACRALQEQLDHADDLLVRSVVPLFPVAALARAGTAAALGGTGPTVATVVPPGPPLVRRDADDGGGGGAGDVAGLPGSGRRDLRPALAGAAVVVAFVSGLALFGSAMAHEDAASTIDAIGAPRSDDGPDAGVGTGGLDRGDGEAGGDGGSGEGASGRGENQDGGGDGAGTAAPGGDAARPPSDTSPSNDEPPAGEDDDTGAPREAPADTTPSTSAPPAPTTTDGPSAAPSGPSTPATEPPSVLSTVPPTTTPPTTAPAPPHLVAAVAWRAGPAATGTLTVTVSAEGGTLAPAGGDDLRVVVRATPGVLLTGPLDGRCRSSGTGGTAGTVTCSLSAPAPGGSVQVGLALRTVADAQSATVTVSRGDEVIGPQTIPLAPGVNATRRSA